MSGILEPVSISPSKAAELLGVSRPTVYTLLKRADFPAFKVGSRTLIPVEGLRAWVEKQGKGGMGL